MSGDHAWVLDEHHSLEICVCGLWVCPELAKDEKQMLYRELRDGGLSDSEARDTVWPDRASEGDDRKPWEGPEHEDGESDV